VTGSWKTYLLGTLADLTISPRKKKLLVWNFIARRFNSCFIQIWRKKLYLKNYNDFQLNFLKVCLCPKGRFSKNMYLVYISCFDRLSVFTKLCMYSPYWLDLVVYNRSGNSVAMMELTCLETFSLRGSVYRGLKINLNLITGGRGVPCMLL